MNFKMPDDEDSVFEMKGVTQYSMIHNNDTF